LSLLQPGRDVGGVLVRREDGVEDLDDPPPLGDQSQALVEASAVELEGGEAQRLGEVELGIGGDGMGETEALGGLPLVVDRLRRDAHDRCSELAKLDAVVAVAAGLRRAPACAGRLVPAGRRLDFGPTGSRVHVEDEQSGRDVGEIELAGRGLETNRPDRCTLEMVGSAVVLGDRKVRREDRRVVRQPSAAFTASRFSRRIATGSGGRTSSQIATKLPVSCGSLAGRAMNHQ
jgi:hypothetical protein